MTRRALAAAAMSALFMLAAPAAADASFDLASSQSVASTLVKKGENATITITVSNRGDEAAPAYIGLAMGGLGGGDVITDNPYVSVTPSQGTCGDESKEKIALEFCHLGGLAAGASMRIVAVVRIEETMKHAVSFDGEDENGHPSGAEYRDGDDSNDYSEVRISASAPPLLTGSKKIRFPGLPQGCIGENFTLKVSVAAKNVKRVAASLFLGYTPDGVGEEWSRVAHGPHLQGTVPIAQMLEYRHPLFATVYKLKVKARIKGGRRLTRTIEFQLC